MTSSQLLSWVLTIGLFSFNSGDSCFTENKIDVVSAWLARGARVLSSSSLFVCETYADARLMLLLVWVLCWSRVGLWPKRGTDGVMERAGRGACHIVESHRKCGAESFPYLRWHTFEKCCVAYRGVQFRRQPAMLFFSSEYLLHSRTTTVHRWCVHERNVPGNRGIGRNETCLVR